MNQPQIQSSPAGRLQPLTASGMLSAFRGVADGFAAGQRSVMETAAFHHPLRLMAVFLLASGLAACGQKEATKAPETVTPPKPEAVSDAVIQAELDKAMAEKPSQKLSSNEDRLANEAEAILAKYPNKNATELLNVPEVNGSLKVVLSRLLEDKALKNKMDSMVQVSAQMQGIDGPVRLDMDLTKYDDKRKARLVQTILSEDPRRVVDFLAEEVGEATPELIYDGVDRSSNGVSIKENPAPAN